MCSTGTPRRCTSWPKTLPARGPTSPKQTALHEGGGIGPITFGRRGIVLPIEPDTLAKLRSMLDRHADPEIAMELTVRDAQGELLSAPDVGDNEILVSKRGLQPSAMEILRAALGDDLDAP